MEGFMKRCERGFSLRIIASNLASRAPLWALVVVLIVLAGCASVPARDMSNDLVPVAESGFTNGVIEGRYHSSTKISGLDIVIREDVSGYVNFTIWVTNNSGQKVDFNPTIATLSARSRDGHGKTYLPMGREEYLEKVRKCYYEKNDYEDFKTTVRSNYLQSTIIDPGKTLAGILRYDILPERMENYTLRLSFGEKEANFRYVTPRQ
jgi:hypothetical protein